MLHAAVDMSPLRIRIQSFLQKAVYSNSAGEPWRCGLLSGELIVGKNHASYKTQAEAGFVDTLEGRLYTSPPEATNRFPPVTGPCTPLGWNLPPP
jgi:hypothetical protein